MRRLIVGSVFAMACMLACNNGSPSSYGGVSADEERKAFEKHTRELERQNTIIDQQLAKADEQMRRYDAILDKWEHQQKRFEVILDHAERIVGELRAHATDAAEKGE